MNRNQKYRKLPLKTALDYAEDVYKFGHQYRKAYETQLEKDGKIVPEDDMREMNKHFREFTNSFADIDIRIRNSVFEAIFAHECNRKDADKLLKLRMKAAKAKGTQKLELENQAERFLESMMRATFKKVSKRPKPTPEELSAYWQKILD